MFQFERLIGDGREKEMGKEKYKSRKLKNNSTVSLRLEKLKV